MELERTRLADRVRGARVAVNRRCIVCSVLCTRDDGMGICIIVHISVPGLLGTAEISGAK